MERKVREENSGRERIVNMPERTRERLCDCQTTKPAPNKWFSSHEGPRVNIPRTFYGQED